MFAPIRPRPFSPQSQDADYEEPPLLQSVGKQNGRRREYVELTQDRFYINDGERPKKTLRATAGRVPSDRLLLENMDCEEMEHLSTLFQRINLTS